MRLLLFFLICIYSSVACAQKTDIAIFKDAAFTAMPEYNADDVIKLFDNKKVPFQIFNNNQLEKLSFPKIKLLILPYLTGNFSDKAFQSLLRFHEQGGGLLFIGDLPNIDKWYPYKNMQSSDLYLTRSNGPIIPEGLTDYGQKILENLPDLDYFNGKSLAAITVTAFPPDITHNLVQNNSDSWALSPVIAVERKCERFFGARLGVFGFYGGEPRENADGAYKMEWSHDPGMLTRNWKGCDSLIFKLATWIYETPDISGAIDLSPVHKTNSGEKIIIRLRNLGNKEYEIKDLCLHEISNDKKTILQGKFLLPANQSLKIGDIVAQTKFGIYNYELTGQINGKHQTIAIASEYVLDEDAADFNGFGFSSYWAFRTQEVSEPFKYFIHQMKNLGMQYVRTNIPWEDVEPKPGIYDWKIPEGILNVGRDENIGIAFWMFPTTRGSGLSDGGVPWWSLKEPAIDRNGKKGFFPSLWSPFYREQYFGMIDTFTRHFAGNKYLDKFILDFGNSDFPYGYNYYVNPPDLFDYSTFEKAAFEKWLQSQMELKLEQVSELYGEVFSSWDEVPVPFAEDKEPWRYYLNFRSWSIEQGIKTVASISNKNAPGKSPKDFPGHGLGSISDLSSSWYDVKSRHWNEEQKFDKKYTELHNSGPEWGGEPWQVGGSYKEYDDALFNSLRYNADYFTIPGPDLSVDPEGIARIGFIRRSIMGAKQDPAEIAVIDKISWDDYQSYSQVAARMDQPVDLLGRTHRFDFSCYKLLFLPNDELHTTVGTVTTGGSMLPADEDWYWLLRQSVEKGLNIVVFPNTCLEGRTPIPLSFLRKTMGIENVSYGERKNREVRYSTEFGGGTGYGMAVSVNSIGDTLLKDSSGEPVLIRIKIGKGAILLAGWDNLEDSFDGKRNYFEQEWIGDHTLNRLATFLNLLPINVKSNQLNIYKSLVVRDDTEYLLLYSHFKEDIVQKFEIKLRKPAKYAFDLATGQSFPVTDAGHGWYSITVPVKTRQGRYFSFYNN